MRFNAKSKFVRYSPYKLRPIADVVRGKSVKFAVDWLATYAAKRAIPVKKIIESAAANAHNLKNLTLGELVIKEIKIDQGPIFRYYKPGAMGRANIYRKRLSHLSVVLEPIKKQMVKKEA